MIDHQTVSSHRTPGIYCAVFAEHPALHLGGYLGP